MARLGPLTDYVGEEGLEQELTIDPFTTLPTAHLEQATGGKSNLINR
jgi:hypothetical protein